MSEPKIQFNVDGTGEITIRQGEALKPQPPEKVVVNGLITAPAEYYRMRSKLVVPDKSHVVCDRNKLSITLHVNENDFYGTTISGTLRYNQELAAFSINHSRMFTLKELTQLIRTKRMHFEDKEQHKKAIEALYKFNAKVVTEIKDEDNRKGNIDKQLKKETETNSPAGFKLDIPIYEGQPSSKIFVDVLADVSDAQAKFWLESVDLIELEYSLANEIINKELDVYKGKIVVLEV